MVAEPDASITPRKGAAAVMIQKTYRGYRARRKLADAAIMSKPIGWWNVVDAVVLREHTQHYYAHSISWKAHDNWKRLKRKASKVGKGLEKNNKALKLSLQHWLEAVDPRHKVCSHCTGCNLVRLRMYLQSFENDLIRFTLWWKTHQVRGQNSWTARFNLIRLDLGSGRQVELQKCSRATLLDQQIKYLSPEQRRHYEVVIYNGKLFYKMSGELVHTGSSKNDRWIFVMSPSGRMYIGKKQKGVFQHSSFLAGGATTAAGRLLVEHGVLKLMEAHSGHYRPSPENFEALVQILIASGTDLHLAKVQLVSDDLVEETKGKKLAGEVRAGIEHAGAEEHVDVNVDNQNLVTVDSGMAGGLSEYLVTNLTFPDSVDNTKRHAAEDQSLQDEARRVSKELTPTIPEEKPANHQVPYIRVAQEDGQPATTEKPPTLKAPSPKTKPCALVVPPLDGMSYLNPNLPRTPTAPTSPGYSRISSLAALEPQERRQTLKKYGPKKSALGTPKKV